MAKNLISSIRDCGLDKMLGIKDDLGVVLKPVYIVIRTWSGARIGTGTATDAATQVKPSPRIIDMFDNVNIAPGGRIEDGDILLTGISKQSYPNKSDIDNIVSNSTKNVEKLYKIGTDFYQITRVKEKYLTWQVEVRKLRYQGSF